MSITTTTSSVTHRALMKKSRHDLASWVLTLLDANTSQNRLLLMVAPSHQGGNGATGGYLADHFGIPFPLTVPELIRVALRDELDPHELWPWLAQMQADRDTPLPHAPPASDPALIALISRFRPQMTPKELAMQRKSWVIGEMMLSDPDLTVDAAIARYDKVTGETAS